MARPEACKFKNAMISRPRPSLTLKWDTPLHVVELKQVVWLYARLNERFKELEKNMRAIVNIAKQYSLAYQGSTRLSEAVGPFSKIAL